MMRELSAPGCPNLVRLVDDGESTSSDEVFAVMNLAPGRELFKVVYGAARRRLPEARALRILLGAARGVCYMHDHGYAHWDVSAENAIVSKRARGDFVTLIDCGLSRGATAAADARSWREPPSLEARGKPSYMAPEVSGCGGGLFCLCLLARARAQRGGLGGAGAGAGGS